MWNSRQTNTFFTPCMPNEFVEFPNQSYEVNEYVLSPEFYNNLNDLDELLKDNRKAEKEKTKLSNASGGLTYPQTSQDQLNQAETLEAPDRKKSGAGRVKLTPDQIRENKKQSDCRYRQKSKRIAAEQAAEAAECKRLKVECEELNAENKMLKELLTCHGLLPVEAPQRQREDTCIAQSTSKQLDHPSDSVQRTAAEQSAEYEHLEKENEEGLLLMRHWQLPEEAPQRQGQEDTCIAQSTSEPLDHPTASVQKTEENLAMENNFLKVENERLNAEIGQLKEDVRLLQLQSEDGQNCHVSKSVSHLPNQIHKGVFVQDHHAMDLRAVNRIVYVTENQENSQTAGTCYNNTPMTELLAKIDADDESSVNLSDFTGLDGSRERVGRYSFPSSLISTVKRIIDIQGDISVTSKISTNSAETIYSLFCASVKEMGDLQLEQLTEDRILKWKDAIKDGLRVNFKVDFAMEHLKKIAHAYIGLIERQELRNMTERISKLEADLNTRKEELAERKELSKKYMDAAEEFTGKSLGLFT